MSTENIVDADRNTLSSFIMIETKDRDLALLMTAMEIACKNIARAVRKAGIAGLLGMAGTRNKSGDQVKKLDLLANLFMINALRKSHVCAVLVSEEEPEPLIMEGQHGKFCVAFDPLDGSSNIDCNVSTGTIFSIFEKKTFAPPAASDILRPGKEMVAAGYCMYGSATELVMTFGQGVERFILDPSLGEFIHIGESIKMPLNGKKIRGKGETTMVTTTSHSFSRASGGSELILNDLPVYSVNEGNYLKWDPVIQGAVQKYKDPKDGSKPYSMRYVGSMVSDVHRTMIYGGIFMYPADKKSKNGKLRLLYEGFPMALLAEQAGGVASAGYFKGQVRRILDLVPRKIHERCPVILGCKRDVEPVLAGYEGYSDATTTISTKSNSSGLKSKL